MADGILLERLGVPTVSIVTDKFRVTALAMAKVHGFPDFPFVTVPHPIASLDLAELAGLAADSLAEVTGVLGVLG